MQILQQTVEPHFNQAMGSFGLQSSDYEKLLGLATVADHGDLAIACHSLSRILKKSPVDIGDELSSILEPLLDGIAEVNSLNGFANLKATDEWIEKHCGIICDDARLGVHKSSISRTVAIDYSSPNVAKQKMIQAPPTEEALI